MLNQDSLAQLKGLKARMEAEKEHAEATVKGTQTRYGFAVLEDGREIFIPPDEMLKAFPDDRVRVCIRPHKGGKHVAEIEQLIDCPIGEFHGRCVRKGKALFVEPDLPRLSRWLFIPPQARNGVQEGDYVRSAILRHPIKDGKPQARILQILGNADSPGIENQYTAAKYQLANSWSGEATDNLRQCLENARPLADQRRRDLSSLEFVSIDSARTQDIDDALYADITSGGWTLYAAIADPTSFIEKDSALEREIAARASSVYFHGDAIPMMPEALSQETCALVEGEDRPALVCKIAVSDQGEVGEFEFIEAVIRSRAKLSYLAVDRYLAGNNDELMSHATPLEALYQVHRALRAHREANELVMEDRIEYRWYMDDNRRIDHIEPHEKLLSHKLVEECMLATNRCAARFLRDRGCNGPFVRHRGFRTDRRDEVRGFLKRFLPQYMKQDLAAVSTYRDIMRNLGGSDKELPLRAMANRLLTRAELDTEPGAHMGMALECYSNCTSPLRKYSDYLAHRQIKAALHGGDIKQVNKAQLQSLGKTIALGRRAGQEAELWLQCRFLVAHTGEDHPGTITHINSNGFTVKLRNWGIEGLIDLRGEPEKFSFDRWTATLSSPSRAFQLEQEIRVRIEAVLVEKREIRFLPVADSADAPAQPD